MCRRPRLTAKKEIGAVKKRSLPFCWEMKLLA